MSNQREKYYVCEKRMNTNEIIVCSATHPALFKQEVVVKTSMPGDRQISPKDMVWINPKSLSLIYSQCKQGDHVFPIQCQLRYQNVTFLGKVYSSQCIHAELEKLRVKGSEFIVFSRCVQLQKAKCVYSMIMKFVLEEERLFSRNVCNKKSTEQLSQVSTLHLSQYSQSYWPLHSRPSLPSVLYHRVVCSHLLPTGYGSHIGSCFLLETR